MLQKKTIFALVALALALVVFVAGCLFWVTQLDRPVHGQGVSFSAPESEASSAVSETEVSSALEAVQEVEPVSQSEEPVSQAEEPEP